MSQTTFTITSAELQVMVDAAVYMELHRPVIIETLHANGTTTLRTTTQHELDQETCLYCGEDSCKRNADRVPGCCEPYSSDEEDSSDEEEKN